jgi:signal transduction histidine kinase
VVFVLAGLTAADRAISNADLTHTRSDARETAAHVRDFLSVHAAALGTLEALLATSQISARDSSRFASLAKVVSAHAPGFRRVWLSDSTGRVVHDALIEADGRIRPAGGAVLPAHAAPPGEWGSRSTFPRITTVHGLPGGAPGIALAAPVYDGARFVGAVGGIVDARALQAQLPPPAEGDVARTLVVADGDTLVADTLAAVRGASPRAVVRLELPGSGAWTVTVVHAVRRRVLRPILWTVGLGVLLALTLGLLHERRLAQRVSERSAELERLSNELLRSNKAKSEFLANVSHELRTPLNAIVGFTDLLRDGVYGELSPRQVGPVQRIEASANHLRHLVDQVLDLAKIAAGRLEVHAESIALRPFVLDVASEVESLVSEKGLSLSIGVGASLPRVRTDSSHLRQILVNLLGNAVKYTNAGSVAVRARLVGPPGTIPRPARVTGEGPSTPLLARAPDPGRPWVALQVADTGVGIAPADQERIFDEFEQVNAGPRGDSMRRGTGLGLSISRRLARLLGGEISVESELGRGSSFTLWLPVDPADVQAQAQTDGTERQTPVAASTPASSS